MSHFKAGEYRILDSDNGFVSVEAGDGEYLTIQVDGHISGKIGKEWIIEMGVEVGQYYIKNKMHNSYAVWKPHYDSDEVTSVSEASTTLDDAKSLWKIVPRAENDGLYRIFPATNGPDRCWTVEDSMLGCLIVLSMALKEGTVWKFERVSTVGCAGVVSY